MARETAKHEKELETLRASLTARNHAGLETLKRQLDIAATSHLREVQDKLQTYRAMTDMVADLFTSFDRALLDGASPQDAKEQFDRFNKERMRIYGYLAMLASQAVMDSYDSLTDFLISVLQGDADYEWGEVRRRVLAMINEIRKDIGINKEPIEYRGIH